MDRQTPKPHSLRKIGQYILTQPCLRSLLRFSMLLPPIHYYCSSHKSCTSGAPEGRTRQKGSRQRCPHHFDFERRHEQILVAAVLGMFFGIHSNSRSSLLTKQKLMIVGVSAWHDVARCVFTVGNYPFG